MQRPRGGRAVQRGSSCGGACRGQLATSPPPERWQRGPSCTPPGSGIGVQFSELGAPGVSGSCRAPSSPGVDARRAAPHSGVSAPPGRLRPPPRSRRDETLSVGRVRRTLRLKLRSGACAWRARERGPRTHVCMRTHADTDTHRHAHGMHTPARPWWSPRPQAGVQRGVPARVASASHCRGGPRLLRAPLIPKALKPQASRGSLPELTEPASARGQRQAAHRVLVLPHRQGTALPDSVSLLAKACHTVILMASAGIKGQRVNFVRAHLCQVCR